MNPVPPPQERRSGAGTERAEEQLIAQCLKFEVQAE